MAKTLELQFVTDTGKAAKIVLDNPKEPIDEILVKQKMQQILASGVFFSISGNYASVKGARLVERNVTDHQIS
ncbi:MAG: DUF2922 domain-containing protein [Bacillota bacterium]|nr:DUF2922 domain-containing protein [Bacillota bacterium]MDP4170596.1 DUF2922 domain-containing protein [Bacillota bacterium]